MHCKNIVLGIACLVGFASCKNIGWDNIFNQGYKISERAVFTDLSLSDSTTIPVQYAVALITDTHFGRPDGDDNAKKFINRLSEYNFSSGEKCLFCVLLGDVANSGSPEEYAKYNEFKQTLNDKNISVLTVPGNHDAYDSGDNGRNYIKYVYPTTFFRLKIKTISYYFLDTADGTLGYEQLQTLSSLMRIDSNKKITFTHYPIYPYDVYKMLNYRERAQLIKLYDDSNVIFDFCGHTHIYNTHDFENFKEVVLSSIVGDDEAPAFVLLHVNRDTGSVYFENIQVY